ncbi:hypothetical protein JTB14_037599, partial [Gonioctena quinquepunctata]
KQIRHKLEITNVDIAAQALVFFLVDSVFIFTDVFLGYELAGNEHVRKFEERNRRYSIDCDGVITLTLLKMKYMDMVISEASRKWPGGLIVERICTKPYIIEPVSAKETPLVIDKGTVLMIPSFAMQRDPLYYPDPDCFDPERFSEENRGRINPYTYLPFGIGPRNCIGSRFALLETKMVFFHLLSKFELIPMPRSTIPLKISRRTFNLDGEGGFWFGFKRLTH